MSNRMLTYAEFNQHLTDLIRRHYGPFYGYWGS